MKNGSITSPCLKSSSLKSSINWEISCRSCQRFLGETGSKKLAPRTFRMADFQSLDVWLWKWVHQNGLSVLIRASWWPLYVCLNYAGNCIPLLWTRALPCFAPMCFNLRPDRQEDWEILFRISHQVATPARGPRPDATPSCVTVQRPTLKLRKKRLRLTSWSVVSFLSIVYQLTSTVIN